MTSLIDRYQSARGAHPNTALLESLGEDNNRFSIAGIVPDETLTVRGERATITHHRSDISVDVDDWCAILDEWAPLSSTPTTGTPQLGAIGYIGYDARYDFERFDRSIPADVDIPDVQLTRYSALTFHDRVTGKITLVGKHDGGSISEQPPFSLSTPLNADFSTDSYRQAVKQTIDYIRAGDIFQANITGRFSATYEGDPFGLYQALRESTPNPFFAYLDGDSPVLSTSPERFFRINGTRITTQPIKGTLRWVVNGVDQRQALVNSAKDRAENTMIVDLMRNDIGRVCTHGSVNVDALCDIRRFNDLYHLESQISGELRPDKTLSDVLRAVFPGGSITGAPKIRAIDIIEELEQHRRGPYCGLIGFFGAEGWIDTSIAIRTAYFSDGRMYTHSGGGITIASDPDQELAELELKIEQLRRTAESTQPASRI